jgi:hypothetical protein
MVKEKTVKNEEIAPEDFNSENFEFIEAGPNDVIKIPKEGPEYGSKEWNDYVMGLFDPSELIDGNPNCAGLRRVAEKLLGDIISSGPSQVYPATDNNGPGRATVIFEVVFDWHNTGNIRHFKEVADCWHGNTDDLFCAHPVATASTRAEGRALRKALKVKCLAAEELTRNKDVAAVVRQSINADKPTTGEISDKDKISAAQLNFVNTLCKKLDINAIKHLNSGPVKCSNVMEMSKKDAIDLLAQLNKYQNGEAQCPPEIKGYDPNWRD